MRIRTFRNNSMSANSQARRGPTLRPLPKHSEPSPNSPLRPRTDRDLRTESQRQRDRDITNKIFEKAIQSVDPKNFMPNIFDYTKPIEKALKPLSCPAI